MDGTNVSPLVALTSLRWVRFRCAWDLTPESPAHPRRRVVRRPCGSWKAAARSKESQRGRESHALPTGPKDVWAVASFKLWDVLHCPSRRRRGFDESGDLGLGYGEGRSPSRQYQTRAAFPGASVVTAISLWAVSGEWAEPLKRTSRRLSEPPKGRLTVHQSRSAVTIPHGCQHEPNVRHRSIQLIRNRMVNIS